MALRWTVAPQSGNLKFTLLYLNLNGMLWHLHKEDLFMSRAFQKGYRDDANLISVKVMFQWAGKDMMKRSFIFKI